MSGPSFNGAGRLRRVIEGAAGHLECSLSSLTVLSAARDPYRIDTPAGRRDGAWFAEQIERFLAPNATVHLRGMHYRIAAAADVRLPSGLPYTNTDEAWTWLDETAAKAARWLGYVAFERIVDERNAPPEIFVPESSHPYATLSGGLPIDVPDLDRAMPSLFVMGSFKVQQPYRIVLIGEKTSLRDILLPIAETVGGELLLPTGEASDTMIAELAARCVADGRPAVALYFSDFDPGGRQMAVSVSRKLQALRDLCHPNLDIQVHAVALTLEQVHELNLPSTPLKDTERRADKWRSVMDHEQTEIDALAALDPDTLREIALEAITPFYDATLARRALAAGDAWHREARLTLESHPDYAAARDQIGAALETLSDAAEAFRQAQETVYNTLRAVRPPPVNPPEPELSVSPPDPLFKSTRDYVTASRGLSAYKALED